MQFKNYAHKTISYEKQMQIAENETHVKRTFDPIRSYLQCANIFNVKTDSLYKQITSVVNISNGSDYFINMKQGSRTEAQKEMMYNINSINYNAQTGFKINFMVDLDSKKYLSASKGDIGVSLCCLYPVNATKPILVLTEENQQLGLYTYIGTPSREGVAYLFAKEDTGAFFIQLHEFHFLSLKKDSEHNYDHGLFLSYNPEWGWKNISFGIILKENQEMVRQLFDSVRNKTNSIEPPNGNAINMGFTNCFCPWS